MKSQETVVEIDVLYLLKTLWRRKFLILLTALFTMSLALLYSVFIAKPEYNSTTRIYVVNKVAEAGQNITTQELQAGSYLVKDYKEIILSQDVLSQVTEELGLAEGLVSKIAIEIPVDTRIVSITVRDQDPNEAARIANHLRMIAGRKIIDVTKVSDVTTLEEARPATQPATPNIKKNSVIGLAVGLFLSAGFVLLHEVLDDRIKRPEDIEEKMGLPLIGVVPKIEN